MKVHWRLTSILLCVVMLFGMVPVSAATISVENGSIAEIGTEKRNVREYVSQEHYISAEEIPATEYPTDNEELTVHTYGTQATEKTASGSPDRSVYYGRSALAQMSKASVLLYAYDQIVAGVEASAASITVYDGTHPITKAELKIAYNAYYYDHAEHFWLGNSYSIASNSTTATRILPSYVMTGSALAEARGKFEAAADKVLAGIDEDMTEYEKELYIHDTLASMIYYDESTNAHNAYGALVEGVAVCEGYAEAFQCLLHRVGIQSHIATGYAGGPHAWNIVRIDGAYYHVDLTWNDQESNLYHAYFNMSDNQIQADHSVEATSYGLPACTATAAFYFNGKDTCLTSYTTAQIAKLLRDNDLRVHIYLPNGTDNFDYWYSSNISEILSAAGVRGGCSYGLAYMENEIILYVLYLGVKVTNDGQVYYYKTVADGLNNTYSGGQVKLMADSTGNVSTTQKFFLDLNGFDINGSLSGSNITVFDSQTDDYTVRNGNGYGVVTGAVTGVTVMDGYIPVTESGGTSYHKVELALDKLVLKAGEVGLYYTAAFRFDEPVAENLVSGIALSTTNDAPVADGSDPGSLYTTAGNSVLVKNILSGANTAAQNNQNAKSKVYARAYLKLQDGTFLYSQTKASNLQTMVETVDAKAWAGLTKTQKESLVSLYQTYGDAMSAWNIPNLKSA